MPRSHGTISRILALVCALLIASCAAPPATPDVRGGASVPGSTQSPSLVEQVVAGRQLVIHHGCGDCHGGMDNPASPVWLSGWRPDFPPDIGTYMIGPFATYARNITPDNATGLGRFSERQLFNALRYGLRPGETPDVEITSGTPGVGNFPAAPKYLAPPMPWPVFRHMSDEEIQAIVAYLKHGLQPVNNRVPDSEGPPDFWASAYAEMIGDHPAPAFPTANERRP